MSPFVRLYDKLVDALALVSGLMLLWLMIAVVASVLIRNIGGQPPAWLFTSTEYSMFYLTLLGAPWLVRERGHVFVEVAIARLPSGAIDVLSRIVMFLCAGISFVLAWTGLELVISNVQGGDYDVRIYFIPMWIFTVTYPISFALMGIEFTRFIFAKNTFHRSIYGEV
ncbi:TRAP-type C4-dicarboxylate transport system, small permease component [Marinobacter sp. es.048]|uniref:TRAP transporter small permease n=1 Tax=Marinobacter sp. es.048 TaxID=1761795 RepID=UPI000B59636B|nr:TRAP transporter small permease subunit [Marinobacter sp. es.048]SNC64764.1 TRAP-type C4-dicarboxylate transport system, small permease component [Marinobacter sp. es.048]